MVVAIILVCLLVITAYKICTAKEEDDDPTWTERESRRLNRKD
jgi:hypothetical protein